MPDVGIGIVGLGMGSSLLPINGMPGFPARIRGVCDVVEERVRSAQGDHGVEFGTDSFDALLDRADIDLVGIYTPDQLHKDQVIQALEAGKHVLVTKPMTISNAESEAVIEAVQRTQKRVMPAQTKRYALAHMAVKRFIDEGEFGEVYFVAADYYQDLRPIYDRTPWRYEIPQQFAFGGLSHNIDIMRFLKDEIVEVAAYGSYSGHDPRYPSDVNETFVVNAKFADGTIGRMAMAPGTRPPLPNVYVQVFGTQGTFVSDKLILDSFVGKPIIDFDFEDEIWTAAEIRVLRGFVDSILGDAPQPLDEIDGARITAVGESILASIESGGAPTKVRLDF